MTEEKKYYIERHQEGLFLRTMLEMFLKRTKQWKTDWLTVIGEDYHFRDIEWKSKYDEFDGDFFSVYVKTSDNTFEEYCFLVYDFLKWDEERQSNPK
jgi:hypothetical protein